MAPKENINKMVVSNNNYKLQEHQNYLSNFIMFVSIIQNLLSAENVFFFLFQVTIFCLFFRPCASAARAGRITSLTPDTPLIITTGFFILLLVGLRTLEDKKARVY
jgi:hypothetical protein